MTSRARAMAMQTRNMSHLSRKKSKKIFQTEIQIPIVVLSMFYGNGNPLDLITRQHKSQIKIKQAVKQGEDWTLCIYCRTRIGLRATHEAVITRLRNTFQVAQGMAQKGCLTDKKKKPHPKRCGCCSKASVEN